MAQVPLASRSGPTEVQRLVLPLTARAMEVQLSVALSVPPQASAVAAFLAGFTVLCAGMASAGVIADLLGVVLIAVSAGLFMKCKPWEHTE